MPEESVRIIGAGFAGSEAAWQIVNRGIKVNLHEMRPVKMTPAHRTDFFAEMVCSNSLRAAALENAVGLLKEEMRCQNSLIMQAAELYRVPAGGALAVDREGFSSYITKTLSNHPLVTIHKEEITEIGKELTIIATGPLTSEALSQKILQLTGEKNFYFYDAAAPIVTLESLDMSKIFTASRYRKGEGVYLNCPFTEEEYQHFWQALTSAEKTPTHDCEKEKFFEGCLPVEVIASRGIDTLRFGPLKPVGLVDPKTSKEPYAVVQLRQDNAAGTLYNLVGFQTRLKWGEQEKVFRMIPGLANAQFVRMGVMHRNSYLNSPRVLFPTLQFKGNPLLLFAGQMTGVEGYVESASCGLVAGINATRILRQKEPLVFPSTTAHGALLNYITSADSKNFQPMNVNFGIFPPLATRVRGKRLRYAKYTERALDDLANFKKEYQL